MSLVVNTLKVQIKNMLVSLSSKTDKDAAANELAIGLAEAIDTYIKSGTVQTTVTGTSVSGGAVTGTGTGAIS